MADKVCITLGDHPMFVFDGWQWAGLDEAYP
jgi:hypothetical protein